MSLRSLLDALAYRALRLILAAIRLPPRGAALAACRAFGHAWARLGGPRTDVAATNLAIAFPDESPEERRRLLVAAFGRMAELLRDFAEIETLDVEKSEALVAFEGFEHIERAMAGGGFILLTAHFGSWELFSTACGVRGIPVSVVHREQTLPGLQRLIGEIRDGSGLAMLRRGNAARAVLRALRDGRAVAMVLDQDTSRKEGVFVPFFGRPACTRTAPARIAMRTGVPVVPGFLYRSPDGLSHVARFGPPLELADEGDDLEAAVIENTRRMSAVVEAAIRRAPDHWTWAHRRWRTAPERGVNIYKPAKSR